MSSIEPVLIPMRDGVKLAGNLYRPAGAGKLPCLVQYLPYHKDGRGGLMYGPVHQQFAERGYATLNVDFRGLGCSEGVNNVPFDAQEGPDGHDIVEWAAAQPWCDGNVGMWGTSYGGITSLKAAAQRPAHLKAIVPINATYDNFVDFLLLGGCRAGFWPNGDWGSRMVSYNLTPPLGDDPDGRLARLWAERLERHQPWLVEWYKRHGEQARWAERAIAIENITAPSFVVCGWKDFYSQGTIDYYHRLRASKKLLMGPWKHVFPNTALERPLNLFEMMVAWWDRWLKGTANGSDAGPPITIFVGGSDVWRHEQQWPPARNEEGTLHLVSNHELSATPPTEKGVHHDYTYDPTVGLDSIAFDPWTGAVLDTGTHNADDVRSLTYTTPPLPDDWDMTGRARLAIAVSGTMAEATVVAKLCDVDEAGRSRLVTMGWCPASLDASKPANIDVALRSVAHLFRKGHRIRVSLALADFPRLWPTPTLGDIKLHQDEARLLLPRTPPQQPALPAPAFPPLGINLKSPAEIESSLRWRVAHELVQRTAALECKNPARYRMRDGGTIAYLHEYTASVTAATPGGAAIVSASEIIVERSTGKTHVRTGTHLTPTKYLVTALIEQDGKIIYQKKWEG